MCFTADFTHVPILRVYTNTHVRACICRAHISSRIVAELAKKAFALAPRPRTLVSPVFTLRLRRANTQLFLSPLLSLFPYSPSSSFHSIPFARATPLSLFLSFPPFCIFSFSLSPTIPVPLSLSHSSVSFVGAQIKSLFLPSFRERRALAPSPSQRLFLPLPRFLH